MTVDVAALDHLAGNAAQGPLQHQIIVIWSQQDRLMLGMPFSLEILGFAAGALTTFCWLPQALKILTSRDTKAISLVTQVAFTLGCSLWAIFGFLAGSPSITIFNCITASLGAAITVLKIRYG